jgi:hypothetical protein
MSLDFSPAILMSLLVNKTSKREQLLEKKKNCWIEHMPRDPHFSLVACCAYEFSGESSGLQESAFTR